MVLLGKKIKELRNKYKYTQTELATLVGVTKSTIAAYENDTRLPSYEVLIKLSHIFKVSLDYLMLDRQMDSVNIDGLNSEQIGVVGDQIFTDVIGGNRCKMFTILVEPIDKKDLLITAWKRPIEEKIKQKFKKTKEKK